MISVISKLSLIIIIKIEKLRKQYNNNYLITITYLDEQYASQTHQKFNQKQLNCSCNLLNNNTFGYTFIKMSSQNELLTSPKNSTKLTIESINKALNKWMNRQEKRDIEQEYNFIITEAVAMVFKIIKEMLENESDKGYKFQDILKTYMGLFLSTGNNQHRYLVQIQLKELLEPKNYEKYRYNKRYYELIFQIFYYYPNASFRIIQSSYTQIFTVQYDEMIKLYGLYIKFANTKRNQKLLEQYIQEQARMTNGSLDKLNILLSSYSNSYHKLIKSNILNQIVKIIQVRNDSWSKIEKQSQKLKILNFCKTMFSINWPSEIIEIKPRVTIDMINLWVRYVGSSTDQKKLINKILETITINSDIIQDLKKLIKNKIKEDSNNSENFSLNCEFTRIILSKFDQEQSESILTKQQYKDMIKSIFNKDNYQEQKVKLLETIRLKNIYNLSQSIEQKLSQIIKDQFCKHFGTFNEGDQDFVKKLNSNIFALKIFRVYNFQNFQTIYGLFKQYILKNKYSKQCHISLKKQILMVCLYILRHKEFKTLQDQKRAFKDIIDLIGQEIELKTMMILYIVDYLNEKFYNQKEIFNIYKESKYQCLLYEDYTTNDMVIKIFSIKTICYLAVDTHSEYTVFLKNAYYQLYDRLSIKELINSEEKETCFKLVREIMRQRAEIFQNQADQLALLLIDQLQTSIEFHSPQTNFISVYIFKIFQALLKKIPMKMVCYVKALTGFIINIMNFKIIKKQLKKMAIETFCDIIQNCNYVILPYFHFKNLYFIIREVLKSDDHNYYYQAELLRLMGKLGYINQQDFVGLQVTNQRISIHLEIDKNFQNIFKEITFIKNVKEKKYSDVTTKEIIIQDVFYSEQKITKSCIQIENYRYYILDKIIRNVSLSCLEINLTTTLSTIKKIIPVLKSEQDQKTLHELLLSRILQIQSKYSNQVLDIIIQLLRFHNIGSHCKTILRFYLNKIFNNKRQQDLVKMLCIITNKYFDFIDSELIDILIVIKKIIIENYQDQEAKQQQKIKFCFSVFINLAEKIDNIFHLFFIDIHKLFSKNQEKDQKNSWKKDTPESISTAYFNLIINLAKKCPSIQYFLPSIRQCLIDYFNKEIKMIKSNKRNNQYNKFLYKIINTMICLMVIYGKRCESFINLLQKNIKENNIYHIFYNISQEYFKKHSNLDYLYYAFTQQQLNQLFFNQIKTFTFESYLKDPLKSQDSITIIRQIQKLSIQQNITQQQVELWINNLSIQLFKNSSQEILRACSDLIAYDRVFSYDLFEVPFYFFWQNLPAEEKPKLTHKIKIILMKKNLSLRIRQKLLDTIYFIQRCQIPFLIKDKILSDVAIDVEDQVKALFYLERQYQIDPELYREPLIDRYAQIGQKESAIGLMKSIKLASVNNKRSFIKLSQKLGIYDSFFYEYEDLKKKKEYDKTDWFIFLQLELKRDIFDWEAVNSMIQKQMNKPQANRNKIAHFAVEASINLGKWDQVQNWIPYLQEQNTTQEAYLWKTMLNIYLKNYEIAQKIIVDTRQKIYNKIRQMFNFSYQKSMKGVLLLQQICELEQILNYYKFVQVKKQQFKSDSRQINNKRKHIIMLWNDRFEGFKNNLYSLPKVLFIRGLILTKLDDIDNWITFCKLALQQNQTKLGFNTYTIHKNLNIKDEIKLLELKFIENEIEIKNCMRKPQAALNIIQEIIVEKKLIQDKRSAPLIFQIYFKYAEGIIQDDQFTVENGKNLLRILQKFPKNKDYYELSHIMGLSHIKIIETYNAEAQKKIKIDKKISKESEENESFRKEKQDKNVNQKKKEHLEQALKCFLNSVTNSASENKYFLQDCLKILNLISIGSEASALIDILQAKYNSIPSQGLIEFIPQIIARLDNNYDQNEKYIHMLKLLLVYIGSRHPQSLLFPLIFLRRGNNEFKKTNADDIYHSIIDRNITFEGLYDEGQLIVEQLCKISLKLSQKVFIYMNKVIKVIKQNDNIAKYMNVSSKIIEFCEKILIDNEKLSSQSQFGFIQEERESLILIVEYLTIFKQLEEIYFFREALKVIKKVVKQTKETLDVIKMIYLEEASIKLAKISKSNVCLFGNYTPNSQNVMIDYFKNQIQIITSKQRPKKLVIIGTDNKNYNYLLKGKEDLRLDERIMQLFTFINKMFHSPSEKENYSIQGYSITPITFEIGIISWVQNCDTIGDLIVDYRKNNGLKYIEAIKMQYDKCIQFCPTYFNLPKYHKVQIFREICKIFSGNDLKNIFWKRAVTSEKWLKNRSCFTRSLAVMSIVGYIIGLGDRHPFNIMLQRDTGKIVHIDFGDCFQVNKMRKSFPEKVPFRLTRMLVNSMQACKTEGIFKQTCEKMMKILRNNKQSILVIIEAFRYDPLIGWKITSKGDKQEQILVQNTDNDVQQEDQQKKKNEFKIEGRNESEGTKHILNNIKNKLNGKESESGTVLSQSLHVDKLIKQAVNPINLVQHYQGWSIFW